VKVAEDGDGDVMVAEEVAAFLRMNIKTVYDLARAGYLPCWQLGRQSAFRAGRSWHTWGNARLRRTGKGSNHARTTR
jgi:Helix-turn-helix domain